MRRSKSLYARLALATATLLVLFAAPSSAQTPSKIINQYLRAEGGAKALARIHATRIEGTVTESPGGRTGSYLLVLQSPDHLYAEIDLGGERWIEAADGLSGWYQDAREPHTLMVPAAKSLEAVARDRNAHLADYRKLKGAKGTVRLAGQEQVNGRPAYKMELTSAWGARREVFFDASSHLLVKESEADPTRPQANQELIYSDYRPVDGVEEPFHLEIHRGGKVLEVSVSKVTHNPSVDARIFNFPQSSRSALPDIASLLKDIERNQKAVEAAVEQYACRKTVEQVEAGEKGKGKVEEYEVFYLAGREVDRLVKKDGKDLGPSEQQKENAKVEKRVREYQEKQAKEDQKHAAGSDREGKHGVNITVSTFLRACRFTNPRRQTFRGQEVIVFDFEPNPGFKPQNLAESIVSKLVGSVWIDEQAHQVVRLEASLNRDLKIGGGLLASLQKGSAFVFEQQKIDNEVWLPSYGEVHASARLLLVKGASGGAIIHYNDYKKFRVESVTRSDGR